jgi:hypothetical protein
VFFGSHLMSVDGYDIPQKKKVKQHQHIFSIYFFTVPFIRDFKICGINGVLGVGSGLDLRTWFEVVIFSGDGNGKLPYRDTVVSWRGRFYWKKKIL